MKHDETNVQQTDRDRSVWRIQTWKAGRVKLDDSDSKQRAEFHCSHFFFASCLLARDFDQDACFINFGSLTSYQQTSSQWRLQQNYHHNSGYSWLKVFFDIFLPYHFWWIITSYFFQTSSEPTNKKMPTESFSSTRFTGWYGRCRCSCTFSACWRATPATSQDSKC